MAKDYLQERTVDEVAAWYLRLADAWDKSMTDLKPSLAGLFLRTWVRNRVRDAKVAFEAPPHLKASSAVADVQKYHRRVFLTKEKARIGNQERWAGILPRVQGLPGFSKWDMKSALALEYESLCDVAPNILEIARIQKAGSNAERDLFGSLRGFQLKSNVTVSAKPASGSQIEISFDSWYCSATDRYDWDYSEHLTVVNPDFRSSQPGAIRPEDQTLTVYHSNAKRLEDAGKAAPYVVVINPWAVVDPGITASETIETARKL